MAHASAASDPPQHLRVSPVRTVRRWGIRALVVTLLIAYPIAEIWALSVVGGQIGFLPTVLVIVATSLLGLVLVLREGSKAWRALVGALREGRTPNRELIDGSLIVFGGLAFLVPGLLTDLIGLVLLLPFSRSLVRRMFGAGLSRSVARDRQRDGVIRGETVPDDPTDDKDDVVVGQLLP